MAKIGIRTENLQHKNWGVWGPKFGCHSRIVVVVVVVAAAAVVVVVYNHVLPNAVQFFIL
jgi:hypothetical protein